MNLLNLNDINYGTQTEVQILPKLKHFFSDNSIIQLKERYSIFDFISQSQRLIIEIKRRRNRFAAYKTTMIGLNKILEAESYSLNGYTVIFLFQFEDGLYYFDYKNWNSISSHIDFEIRHGGTQRRDKDERHKHAYIPVKMLHLINDDEIINYTRTAL